MKVKLLLYRLANKFRDNKIIYRLGKPLMKRLKEKEQLNQLNNFHKHGTELIQHLSNVAKANDFTFWIDFGTLLGAVRERGFIKHDNDIDVGANFNDRKTIQDALLNNGFVLEREFIIRKDSEITALEQTYSYKKVLIDFFYYIDNTPDSKILFTFVPIQDDPNLTNYAEVKETVVPYFGLKPMEIFGTTVNIPADEVSYLKFHYGDNFMIPDPNYNSKDHVKSIKYHSRNSLLAEFYQHNKQYL